MQTIHELTERLARLPGLGPRQARRVVQHLLTKGPEYRLELARLIEAVGMRANQCVRCQRFDEIELGARCRICADHSRDATYLVVVESDVDIDALESTNMYAGYYFVLGGHYTLSKQRSRAAEPRLNELVTLVHSEPPKEVIFALAATPEGDFTAGEVAARLRRDFPLLKLSTLGRGLSIGAELEYADPETLRSALRNRT